MDDAAARAMLDGVARDGFAYWQHPGRPGWGLSMVSAEWVVRGLVGRGNLRLLGYRETGWYRGQDVVVCDKPNDWAT